MKVTPSITGHALDTAPQAFGRLRSSKLDTPTTALRRQLEHDGYLYLPGFFESEHVLAVRRELVRRLAEAGALEPGTDPIDAVARVGASLRDLGHDNVQLARGNQPMQRLLYSGQMISFYDALLGGPVRHFDYTWVRVTAPGAGTYVHTDIVFMGRGTTNLYTSWVPYGDIDLQLGGLAILERSHVEETIREGYGRQDIDNYCENLGERPLDWYEQWAADPNAHYMKANPVLAEDAAEIQLRLGRRWLTADYKVGDLLLFGMYTAHAAIDNQTNRYRLSTDSRYQLASEPIDERWIGASPPGHTKRGKRGMIC